MRSKHVAGLALTALTIRPFRRSPQETVRETEAQAPKRPPVEIIFTGGLGVTSLKTSAADKIPTGTGGLGLDLGGGVRFWNFFDIGVGLGICWLADHNEFTNSTTGGERSSSRLAAFLLCPGRRPSPHPDPQQGWFPKVWVAFHAGTMGVSADRSIMSCYELRYREAVFEGGWFYTPEIRLQRGKGIYIGVRLYHILQLLRT